MKDKNGREIPGTLKHQPPGVTRGDWQAVGVFIGTAGADSQTVGYAADHRNRRSRPVPQLCADARLMAAAPVLYSALWEARQLLRRLQGDAVMSAADFEALEDVDDAAGVALKAAGAG